MTEPLHQPVGTTHDEVSPVAYLLPLGLGLLLFAWPTLVGLAGVYRTDGNFSHGFLVPLISAYAAWQQRHQLIPARGLPRLFGFVPLAAGLGFVLFSRWYELALLPRGVIAMFMAGFGLLLTLTGLVWVALGWAGVRRLSFPLGYLLLGLPIPSFLLHCVTIPLQQVAAAISAVALRVAGILVQRQGSVLQFADGGQLGVDEACSGIRSLAVLAAVVLAMIHFNRPSRRGAVLLLLATAPLAVLTNAVRVFVSGIFFALDWKQLTHGGPHELLGLFTFALAISGLAALSSLVAERRHAGAAALPAGGSAPAAATGTDAAASAGPEPLPPPPAPARPLLANAAFAAALMLFCGAAVSLVLNVHYDRLYARDLPRLAGRRSLSEFPARLGRYVRIARQDLSSGEFSMLDPSDQSIGTYLAPDGRKLTATILYWDPPAGRPSLRPDLLKRPHSPDWCYPAAGWERLRHFDGNCPADVFPGELGRSRVFEREGQSLVVLFWTGITAARDGSFNQVFQRLADMLHSWSNPPLANLHTVSICTHAEGDPASARDAAMALARELARILPDYGVGQRQK